MKTRFLGLLLLALSAGVAFAQSEMSVTVKETQVRDRPSFLAKSVAKVAYGDRLTVMSKRSGWVQVKVPANGMEGWVSASALTEKKIVFQAGASNVDKTASSSEVALAGRGFNKEVEAKYKSANDLDYTWVDRMETYGEPTSALVAFMEAAGLHYGNGGDK